jgi:hypothetical protein
MPPALAACAFSLHRTGIAHFWFGFINQHLLRASLRDKGVLLVIDAGVTRALKTMRALTPADGGNSAAGKSSCRQIAAAARAQMAQVKQTEDRKQTIRKGATHDNR